MLHHSCTAGGLRPRHTSIAPAPSCLEKTGMFSDLGERVLLRRKFWKGAACPGILLELPGQEALPGTPSGTFAAIGLCVGPLDHVAWCGIFHLDVRYPGPAICPQGSQSYTAMDAPWSKEQDVFLWPHILTQMSMNLDAGPRY